MSKAKRNRLLRAQAEDKNEARQLRRKLWKFKFPRSKPQKIHPRLPVMPFSLTPEEYERMQRAQKDYRR